MEHKKLSIRWRRIKGLCDGEKKKLIGLSKSLVTRFVQEMAYEVLHVFWVNGKQRYFLHPIFGKEKITLFYIYLSKDF
jgi:hypothetical protein